MVKQDTGVNELSRLWLSSLDSDSGAAFDEQPQRATSRAQDTEISLDIVIAIKRLDKCVGKFNLYLALYYYTEQSLVIEGVAIAIHLGFGDAVGPPPSPQPKQ